MGGSMSDSEEGGVDLGKSFMSSRVKKRFFTQMNPLGQLLCGHGVECSFMSHEGSVCATVLRVSRKGDMALVGVAAGERRFREPDQIFQVCPSSVDGCEDLDQHVSTNCLTGVLQTMLRWGMLREGEITARETRKTAEEGCIRCSGCDRRQPWSGKVEVRFKQCKLCHAFDKTQTVPNIAGMYCSVECQRDHWREHKKQCHCV